MRSLTFHRLMARLALAAVLLLALAPTVNRLLDSGFPGAGGLWEQMCTAHGLKLVQLPLDRADAGQSQSQGDTGGDCAYCPLLNALTALALCVLLFFPQTIGRFLNSPIRAQLRSRICPGGLGARGPPLMA
jgi:hypothetical protein